MNFVDSHHHFWDPTRRDYYWMGADILAPIRIPRAPAHLQPEIAAVGVTKTLVVQTIPSVEETREFLQTAVDTDFVAGVVGWADLTDPDIASVLGQLKSGAGGRYLVGIRHQIHDEEDADWARRSDVKAGVQAVGAADLIYDLLPRERELPACIDLVAACPDTQFVLDHIGKPRIGEGAMQPWLAQLEDLASHHNVSCKLSGLATEADWENWTIDDLRPYAAEVISRFGEDRVMFGSDWPVVNLATDYQTWFNTAMTLVQEISPGSVEKIFGENAKRIYSLPD